MPYNVYVIELDKEVLKSRKFRKYNPIKKREEAEYIEQILTEKLRKKGHGVWSN